MPILHLIITYFKVQKLVLIPVILFQHPCLGDQTHILGQLIQSSIKCSEKCIMKCSSNWVQFNLNFLIQQVACYMSTVCDLKKRPPKFRITFIFFFTLFSFSLVNLICIIKYSWLCYYLKSKQREQERLMSWMEVILTTANKD